MGDFIDVNADMSNPFFEQAMKRRHKANRSKQAVPTAIHRSMDLAGLAENSNKSPNRMEYREPVDYNDDDQHRQVMMEQSSGWYNDMHNVQWNGSAMNLIRPSVRKEENDSAAVVADKKDGGNDSKSEHVVKPNLRADLVIDNYLNQKLQEQYQSFTDPNLPKDFPRPNTQIKLKDICIHWTIFGGFDWPVEETAHSDNPSNFTKKRDESEVIEHLYEKYDDDFERQPPKNKTFDSENASHASMPYRLNKPLTAYQSHRRVDKVMQFSLNHTQLFFYQFAKKDIVANRVVLSVETIEILDQIRESNFHKFLCFYRKHYQPYQHMFHFTMDNIRPEPYKDPERLEARVNVTILPLRLNVDQIAIDFLIEFFSGFANKQGNLYRCCCCCYCSQKEEICACCVNTEPNVVIPSEQEKPNESEVPNDEKSEASFDIPAYVMETTPAPELADSTMEIGNDDENKSHAEKIAHEPVSSNQEEDVDQSPLIEKKQVSYFSLLNDCFFVYLLVYFYLLVHFFPLSQVEITLQPFKTTGTVGWDGIALQLAWFWALDFSKHQAHRYVAGIQPVRSIVNVSAFLFLFLTKRIFLLSPFFFVCFFGTYKKIGSGVADLVLLPIKQFQKDGQLLRGLQQGARSFAHSMTMETLELSEGLFSTAHSALSTVHEAMDSAMHYDSSDTNRQKKHSRGQIHERSTLRKTELLGARPHMRQPRNTADGLRQAYECLSRGVFRAGHVIVAVPLEKYKASGIRASIKSVLKGVPSAILHPVIGATEAASKALVGIRNEMEGGDTDFNDQAKKMIDMGKTNRGVQESLFYLSPQKSDLVLIQQKNERTNKLLSFLFIPSLYRHCFVLFLNVLFSHVHVSPVCIFN
ncbi:hypothetical protein RFI_00063 [Reticulomyxa filosa]|uniref:Autophagy-related protein 2 n=1 Tax=Reticulomyxa filosa TaxID=46433 RepID=X6PFW7_RETFI|nr:hypothetical protein RFI_00063 [Reticulomyxa filosa]|eukprot:ETO36998.1 hypothetical protein RFI_00063 [Reticulomyxa filosa]